MVKVLAPLLALAAASAQQWPTGQVIDRVVCQADAAQSYALYLPSNYDPSRIWPVVFCLDPVARGRVPVNLFRAGAEKFGYIAAGSNNSRNGPWAPSVAAFEAMTRDAAARFSIDARRVYLAGFSGGARSALSLAAVAPVAGVIACGAAFPGSAPPKTVGFAVFGAAGIDDFNYSEMRRTDRELDARGSRHRVAFFGGGHDWAPPDVLARALEWFEIEAMRAGLRPEDGALVQAALAARVAGVATLAPPEAYAEYKSLAADFAGFAPVDEFRKKAEAIGKGRDFNQWERSEQEQDKRERQTVGMLTDLAEREAAGELVGVVAQWKKKSEAPRDSPDRRVARRALGGASIYGAETGRALLDSGEYRRAAALFELAATIRPDRAEFHFSLARARAFLGDKKKAVAALKQAVDHGFQDAARVQADRAFASFLRDPGFQAILASMRN